MLQRITKGQFQSIMAQLPPSTKFTVETAAFLSPIWFTELYSVNGDVLIKVNREGLKCAVYMDKNIAKKLGAQS